MKGLATMNPLAAQHCKPLEGQPPMAADDIEGHLAHAPGWALVEGAIQKRYDFADYHRTMAFVNALAWIAHSEDHHPDLMVSYNRCTVRFNTHSVGGISINDFICAARVDALLP
jgi:4a-hydroxytetrahydrobiopterin dehydratase